MSGNTNGKCKQNKTTHHPPAGDRLYSRAKLLLFYYYCSWLLGLSSDLAPDSTISISSLIFFTCHWSSRLLPLYPPSLSPHFSVCPCWRREEWDREDETESLRQHTHLRTGWRWVKWTNGTLSCLLLVVFYLSSLLRGSDTGPYLAGVHSI